MTCTATYRTPTFYRNLPSCDADRNFPAAALPQRLLLLLALQPVPPQVALTVPLRPLALARLEVAAGVSLRLELPAQLPALPQVVPRVPLRPLAVAPTYFYCNLPSSDGDRNFDAGPLPWRLLLRAPQPAPPQVVPRVTLRPLAVAGQEVAAGESLRLELPAQLPALLLPVGQALTAHQPVLLRTAQVVRIVVVPLARMKALMLPLYMVQRRLAPAIPQRLAAALAVPGPEVAAGVSL